MLNNVVLMGRLTADPELRHTAMDIANVKFTIAVDRNYTKAGEEKKADFIRVVAWRQTAEFISNYFHKGDMIAITGSIQTDSYEDKNGNKVFTTDVIVDRASFCGSKSERTSQPKSNGGVEIEEIPDDDDDLPFD